MKKVAVFFANGTEEIEGLTPVDVIRRAGAECDIVSVSGLKPIGSHGIEIKADLLVEDANLDGYDALVIPGGMPGAVNISNCTIAVKAIENALKNNKLVCAICASPAVVLADNNLLFVEKATCYPFEKFIILLGDKYTGQDVCVCENVITANGPKSAMAFSLEICKALSITPKF